MTNTGKSERNLLQREKERRKMRERNGGEGNPQRIKIRL